MPYIIKWMRLTAQVTIVYMVLRATTVMTYVLIMQGRSQDLEGGARFGNLLGGFGGMPPHPEKFLLNSAIWCVLVCILIRFVFKIFRKISFFI